MTKLEYQKQWRLANPDKVKAIAKRSNAKLMAKRRGMLAEIKLASGCVDCGYNAAPEALHFDHIDPSLKKFNIGTEWARAWTDIQAEINKCVVRCANCHAIRSKREGHNGLRVTIE
jgi:hypothetical protein